MGDNADDYELLERDTEWLESERVVLIQNALTSGVYREESVAKAIRAYIARYKRFRLASLRAQLARSKKKPSNKLLKAAHSARYSVYRARMVADMTISAEVEKCAASKRKSGTSLEVSSCDK